VTSAERRGFRRTIAFGAAAVVLTAVVVILTSSQAPDPSPTEQPSATPVATAQVHCSEDPGPLAPGLSGPACPAAILAVELAVSPVRLPIERITIEPGPFFCDLIWPGVQRPAACSGFSLRPGQYMHAWASFTGSPIVAAVMLGIDLPNDDAAVATRPPWSATLVVVEIPPDGWVLP